MQEDGVFKGHMGYFSNGSVRRIKIKMNKAEEEAVAKSCDSLDNEWKEFQKLS